MEDNVDIQNNPKPVSKKKPAKTILSIIGIVVLLAVGIGIAEYIHLVKPKNSSDLFNPIMNPENGFPGKTRLIICAMGIDDNETNQDIVYTTGSRTDTLFLMSLDLKTKKVSMLSIPRDTYVPIAGTHYSSKINSAYATGGPQRTEATIQNWLGVTPDYYVVLNMDATKKLVDALGGVDVNVEHQMDYDDNWGYLHVHLKPGFQHLDGAQAVGFARFRHPNKGTTLEDGDERRMYRQHMLLRAMIAQAKTPQNLLNFNGIIDTGWSCVHTNLTRTQLADLAAIFHSVNQDTDVQTVSLKGVDGKNRFGAYVMLVNQNEAKQYCKWVLYGDDAAGRSITPVRVANATPTPGLANAAKDVLESVGYINAKSAGNVRVTNPQQTEIIDQGVPDKTAVTEIASSLGLSNPVVLKQPVKPNKNGWTPDPVVQVDLGSDYIPKTPSNNANAATSSLPLKSS